MSRKRKHRDDKDDAAESATAVSNEGDNSIDKAHRETPVFEPLTPTPEILNQINNALTASTLVQSPLMDGKQSSRPADN
jgi:hypothetical protein